MEAKSIQYFKKIIDYQLMDDLQNFQFNLNIDLNRFNQ